VFQRHEKQTELPSLGLVFKYNLFNSSSFSKVLSLENNTPVLSAGNYKNGKLYVLSSPLTDINVEFMKSTLFVPSFFNIALNSQINNDLYAVLKEGEVININSAFDVNETDIFEITNNKDIDIIANFRLVGKTLKIQVPHGISDAGNYILTKSNHEFVSNISLNYDRKESALDYYNKSELEQYSKTYFNNRAKVIEANSNDINIELKEISEGKQLWQIFLLLALIFILCEIAFARILK
jgi:hypothetical protein